MSVIVWIVFGAIILWSFQRSRRFWARGLPKPGANPPDIAESSRKPSTPDDGSTNEGQEPEE